MIAAKKNSTTTREKTEVFDSGHMLGARRYQETGSGVTYTGSWARSPSEEAPLRLRVAAG